MKEAVYHIGRNKNSNEIYVFNETVSSSHAQIIIDENGDLIIIDLSSKNGISVNNEKIASPVKLFKDDLITIGEFKCTQADLLNAVRVFEFKNQKPGKVESVPLESSVNPQIDSYPESPGTKWYQNKKLMIIILVVLGLVILAIGTKFLIDQQSIKKGIEKKSIVKKTNAVVQALIKIGVDKKSIQSLQVQFNPWIEYNGKTREQKGFILTRQVKVKLKTLTQYEQSIDAVLGLGVNNMNQFSFTNSQGEENYQVALKQALLHAKQRATDMANVLDLKLAGVISISEQSFPQVAPVSMQTRQFKSSESYKPGEMSTQARVKVIFALQDAS